MLWAPVAVEAFGEDIARGFDAVVLEGGEGLGVAFTIEDGGEDGLAGDPGEVADDMVELNVHLCERFLEVVDAAACSANEGVAMTKNGAHCTDLVGGAEAGTQEADGMKILEPLAVLNIGLTAWEIFAVTCVDEADFDAGALEDLEERNPIDAGGLHGDGSDVTLEQPVTQSEEILGEGGEGTNGMGMGVWGNGDVDLTGTDINARGAGMEDVDLRGGFSIGRIAFATRSHRVETVKVEGGRVGPQRRKASEQSPERDERGRVKVRALTSDLHGGCSPKLTHGLWKAPLAGRDTLPTAHPHHRRTGEPG
jgi:hypothetical protein